MSENKTSKIISYSAFLFTLGIIGLSVISLIFPALIISFTYEYHHELQAFEPSPWLVPVIISLTSFIIIGYLYSKYKLPALIQNTIKFVLNFEISKKIAIISGIIIISIYIGFSIPELYLDEVQQWPDFLILQRALDIWPSTDSFSVYVKEQNTRYVRMILLDFSDDFLGNIKILPFFASTLTVIFTALVTIQLSKKYFAGIISMIVLLQSRTFTDFDTIAVYENFWVLFYLISIYSINKKWNLASPITFMAAIFTKAFIATYFWANLFFIYRSGQSLKSKISLFVLYGIVIGITYWIFESGRSIIYDDIVRLNFNAFLDGFTGWSHSMQIEPFLVLLTIPLLIGLFVKSLNGIKQSDSILIILASTLLAGPLISYVTDFYFILPYRFIPFVVFMAIGIGIIFSKKT
tara:strand:+ start:262 stop:1482 length:1221 start_codon:yes stop_codon:yes gene_type:complete